jgi:hypothetical protein
MDMKCAFCTEEQYVPIKIVVVLGVQPCISPGLRWCYIGSCKENDQSGVEDMKFAMG